MDVGTVKHGKVHRNTGVHRNRAKEFLAEFSVEFTDFGFGYIGLETEIGAIADIESAAREALFHWHVCLAVAFDSSFVAESGFQYLTENNAHVLDGMVRINLQIAFAAQIDVEKRVAGEQVEHMFKERDAD